MKNILLLAISLIFVGLISTPLFSQGVAINTSGNPADSSAMLDVQSTSGGILIPRMTLAQRGNLASPASGLLIYQTDNQPGFYFYNGTVLTKISTGLDVTGTQNYVSKFTGANSLGNSLIFDNGTNVGIGTTSPDYRFTVVDSTGVPAVLFEATGVFINKSIDEWGIGVTGICD
ncbi:MAG TPA: hypothetical protein PLA77_04775, partial [Bacteroidales bacterium]|nr:hypothetical protein [Bacteroidales bacterium]